MSHDLSAVLWLEILSSEPSSVVEEREAGRGSARSVKLFFALLAIAFVVFWPLHARYLYEWDSVQFALGAQEYDVYKHHPHPPGYPIWIVLIKAIGLVVRDVNVRMIVLSIVFTAGACAALHDLAERRLGRRGALFVTVLLLFTPNVFLYSTVATTYTVDLFISAWLGLLSARLWKGEGKLLGVTFASLALLAGVRQSGALLMAPLVCLAMLRCFGLKPSAWLRAGAIGGAAFLVWFVPTAWLSGGPAKLLAFNRLAVGVYFSDTSFLFGAPAERHIDMLREVALWLALSLAVPFVLALSTWLASTIAARRSEALEVPRALQLPSAFFFSVWIVPDLLYVTLLHSPKPGYLNLMLPPLVLLLGGIAFRHAERFARLRSFKETPMLAVAAGAAVVLSVAISAAPYERCTLGSWAKTCEALHVASRGGVSAADTMMDSLTELVHRPGERSEQTMIVTNDGRRAGANFKKITYYFPGFHSFAFGPDGYVGQTQSPMTESAGGHVPGEVRRIHWITHPGGEQPVVRDAFEGTRLALTGDRISVWVTEIGDRAFDVVLPWGNSSVRLFRGNAAALGDGFAGVEKNDAERWVWAMGPTARIKLAPSEQATGRVTLQASNSPFEDQEMAVSSGRLALGTFKNLRPEVPCTVEYPNDASSPTLDLTFKRWKDDVGHGDPRALALSFRSVTLDVDGRTTELVRGVVPEPRAPASVVKRIEMTSPESGGFLERGWGGPESGFRWTEAEEVGIGFVAEKPGPLALTLKATAFEKQRVFVELNGSLIATLLANGAERSEISVDLPEALLTRDNRLVLRLPDAKSPKVQGIGDDPRRLALAVRALEFSSNRADSVVRSAR